MSITIIVGKPGAGKTALAVKFMVEKMLNSWEDIHLFKKELKKFRVGGFSYLGAPPQNHLCYSDTPIKINSKLKAYDTDGYKIGLPNPYFKTQLFPPYSTILLDEAQRYYDSRNSKSIRPEVYNFYQLHRQNHLNFIMTCQRLDNIDVNIRSLAEKIIVIDNLKIEFQLGVTKNLKWLVHEFESPDIASEYCSKKDKVISSELGGEKLTYKSNFPLFKFYDSYINQRAFFDGMELKNFDFSFDNSLKDYSVTALNNYNLNHSFTAPEGYWKSADYDKKIMEKLKNGNQKVF